LSDSRYIVFFDGYCGLCSWAVDFLIARDKQKKFKYSPLQGQYIKKLNIELNVLNLETLYVYDGKNILSKTKAWQVLAYELGGVWKFLSVVSKIIPIGLLDLIYDVVAKNRHKFFGKLDTCRLPTPEQRELFLD
jgi:predicted DCC family thiol-disulfide oxidoreductase YuxK